MLTSWLVKVRFQGMESFKGPIFHTARWDHSVSYKDKKIVSRPQVRSEPLQSEADVAIIVQAVIGNGCIAVQVIPAIAKHAESVKQYARSLQWYHERPNRQFTSFEKWVFRWVPLFMRLHRWNIFRSIDKQSYTYRGTDAGVRKRLQEEEEARQYIYSKVPERYHNLLVPDFELGCKRKIADPEYLDSLNRENMELIPEGL